MILILPLKNKEVFLIFFKFIFFTNYIAKVVSHFSFIHQTLSVLLYASSLFSLMIYKIKEYRYIYMFFGKQRVIIY